MKSHLHENIIRYTVVWHAFVSYRSLVVSLEIRGLGELLEGEISLKPLAVNLPCGEPLQVRSRASIRHLNVAPLKAVGEALDVGHLLHRLGAEQELLIEAVRAPEGAVHLCARVLQVPSQRHPLGGRLRVHLWLVVGVELGLCCFCRLRHLRLWRGVVHADVGQIPPAERKRHRHCEAGSHAAGPVLLLPAGQSGEENGRRERCGGVTIQAGLPF
mmetsp:Transcript_22074/g.48442  ORF Transcript_22074/g.48442 Transcript_22074/m.48442 type:complete len:215 (-) Transcript_22074:769-1413(-)